MVIVYLSIFCLGEEALKEGGGGCFFFHFLSFQNLVHLIRSSCSINACWKITDSRNISGNSYVLWEKRHVLSAHETSWQQVTAETKSFQWLPTFLYFYITGEKRIDLKSNSARCSTDASQLCMDAKLHARHARFFFVGQS